MRKSLTILVLLQCATLGLLTWHVLNPPRFTPPPPPPVVVSASPGSAGNGVVGPEGENPAAGPHTMFDRLLAAFVEGGKVDYAGLRERESDLDRYLAVLNGLEPESMTRAEQFALWVNAYNAFTLKLILEFWPDVVDGGIRSIPAGLRWKHERWYVGGKPYSLDGIEHEILRPMGDARIHFALVCAAVSCPGLSSEAFFADRLDEQLDDAGRRFLADAQKGLRIGMESRMFGRERPVLHLSSIFRWFREDFETDGRDLVDFVLPYVSGEQRALILEHRDDLTVSFLDYDWSLNQRTP